VEVSKMRRKGGGQKEGKILYLIRIEVVTCTR
jgi:hypothetical protein